jgi:hypothetical protein
MENTTGHGAEAMNGKTCGGKCGCGHHKVFPILVILFGLAFLLAQVNVLSWNFVGVTWPILVIIAGIMKLCGGMCKCCCKK